MKEKGLLLQDKEKDSYAKDQDTDQDV